MFKRITCAVLALCLLTTCAAVAENVEDALILGIVSTRTTELRPLNPLERDILSIYGVVYESLVYIDDNGLPQPLLAETWTESGDGKTWTFTLRENLLFSDGTPLTAADVVASCEYLLAMAKDESLTYNGYYQTLKFFINSIKAQDERTVVVKAARAYYGLLYAMTFPVVPAGQTDIAAPVGSGPYVISSFAPGNYLMLDANPSWWQTAPQVKSITVTLFPSNKDLITAYEYGRVDTAFTRSVAASQYKSGISSLSITYSTRQLETLLINHRKFPLDDLNVRLAIRYAIDANLISNNVYMGMTIDADTPIASSSWLYDDSMESAFQYNIEKAKQLLEDAGWIDLDGTGVRNKVVDGATQNLHLQFCVYEDPENDVRFETANMISDMLKSVGIELEITNLTYEQEEERLAAGSFELALASFQMDVCPEYGFFLMKGYSQNFCRYNSGEMTTLFNTLRESTSQQDFAYTWQAIQRQFAADVPFICLFYRAGAVLTRKMYTTVRDLRELELLRGVEAFGR